ncbi:hypothetical protein [Nitratireductor sp. PBL-C9]|uniref:hypothetical protein n=1 Tax=Nitratireductor sp. PBL-C9 TaxID=3435013 RepID=UPI003D7DF995
MQISYSPQRRDASLSLSKLGDVLTVNGEAFDLSVVPDGATLPQEAISSDWFAGPVERIGGELHISLFLPHGPNPSQAVAFPHPITVNDDGPIELPSDEPVEAGE